MLDRIFLDMEHRNSTNEMKRKIERCKISDL